MEFYCLTENALGPVVFFLLPQDCAPLSEGGRFAQLIVELPVELLRGLEVLRRLPLQTDVPLCFGEVEVRMGLAERMIDCLKERQCLADQIHCPREAVR